MNLPTRRAMRALEILSGGGTLDDVREQVPAYRDRSEKSIKQTLERVAKKLGVPKPQIRGGIEFELPPVRGKLTTDDSAHIKKAEAWSLRVQGKSWGEVAEALDLETDRKGRDLARKWANRWGQRKGWDCTVLVDQDKLYWGRQYWLGFQEGKNWTDMEREYGRHCSPAIGSLARWYAEQTGIEVPDFGRHDIGEVVAWIFETGASREEAAEHWGYRDSRSVSSGVFKYCDREGIEPPWEKAYRGVCIQGRAEEAYRMRAQGSTWASISRELGYADGGLSGSVKKWAARVGKPWPPQPLPESASS